MAKQENVYKHTDFSKSDTLYPFIKHISLIYVGFTTVYGLATLIIHKFLINLEGYKNKRVLF